jgi:hypothetical protein
MHYRDKRTRAYTGLNCYLLTPMRLCFSTASVVTAVVGFSAILSACDRDSKPRYYSEVAFRAKASPMAAVDIPIHITWTLPSGWIEQPGSDPLRIASFLAADSSVADSVGIDPNAVDISIVQFGGMAGGVEANISRWMGQAKILPSPELVQKVLAEADSFDISSGQKALVVDFTGLLAGDMTQTTSILGVIIRGDGYTVFVKAMGDRDRLATLKPQFLNFCHSVSIISSPTPSTTPAASAASAVPSVPANAANLPGTSLGTSPEASPATSNGMTP